MLGALALMATGFLFAAPAAQAQVPPPVVNCTVVGGGQQTWPYTTTRYCGSAANAQGTAVAGALNSIWSIQTQTGSAPHAGAQLAALQAPFMVFGTHQEYYNWYWHQFGHFPSVLDTSVAGLTTYSGAEPNPGPAIYTVVFKQVVLADGSAKNVNLKNATVHEAGHWFDLMYATKLGSPTTRASNSNSVVQNTTKDWTNLNNPALYLPCTNPGNVFNTQKDYLNHSICSGSTLNTAADVQHGNPPATHNPPPFVGNNQTVLNAAWPNFFNVPKELWAEEVAKELGATDQGGNQSISGYFKNSQFTCTRTLIKSLIKYGEKPGVAPSPYPWPTPAGHQTCFTGN